MAKTKFPPQPKKMRLPSGEIVIVLPDEFEKPVIKRYGIERLRRRAEIQAAKEAKAQARVLFIQRYPNYSSK